MKKILLFLQKYEKKGGQMLSSHFIFFSKEILNRYKVKQKKNFPIYLFRSLKK